MRSRGQVTRHTLWRRAEQGRLTDADREQLRDQARTGDLEACALLARNAARLVPRLK